MKIIEYLQSKTQGYSREPRNEIIKQFVKYFFAGGISFLVDFGFLILLTEVFNIYYLISAGISYSIGLTMNYFLSINWVFDTRTYSNRLIEISLFMIIGISGLVLNEILLWIFTEILDIYYPVSKLITIFIVFVWNFCTKKFILFYKYSGSQWV